MIQSMETCLDQLSERLQGVILSNGSEVDPPVPRRIRGDRWHNRALFG